MSHKATLLSALLIAALLPHVSVAALAGVSSQASQSGQFTGGESGADAGGAGGAHAPTASQVAQAAGGSSGGGGASGGASSGGGTPSQSGNANAVSSILHPAAKKDAQAISTEPPEPMDNDEVRGKLMDNSINAYPGKCACPYSRNNDGFECGVEAAYYKPGGYRIYCYPEDVRKQLDIYYRKTH